MAAIGDVDDATSAATSLADEASIQHDRRRRGQAPVLTRVFQSCESDPLGSVHRAWAVSVLCMVIFFVFAIVEANKLREGAATLALQVAAYYTAAIHFVLTILGTFVLKRFATAFTVGCFLGVTLVLAQQNLLMFAAFLNYSHGDRYTNSVFSNLAFALFLLLGFFTLILGHFKDKIIVA